MVVIGNTRTSWKIADLLGRKFVLLEQKLFPDTEMAMSLALKEVAAGSFIDWRFSLRESLDAQILRLVSLLRCVGEGKRVNLLLPYFPYARSLPWDNGLVVASAEPMLSTIKEKVGQLFVVDLHCENEVLQSYVDRVQIHEISMKVALADFIENKLGEVVLVAPDRGSERRVQHLSTALGVEYLVMDKERLSARDVRVQAGDMQMRTEKLHVIVDDIISTGGTLKAVIDYLREHSIRKIACVVTHNVAREDTSNSFVVDDIPIYSSNSLNRENFDIDIVDSVVEVIGERVRQV